ncbi:hypothetical protein V1478_014114 [Vespula squamosa]|uniref:Uncharacterized protein n=1 Tax=Vespula squamosa TaxID=30214 RepID=A0ABD2A743_VESSQ
MTYGRSLMANNRSPTEMFMAGNLFDCWIVMNITGSGRFELRVLRTSLSRRRVNRERKVHRRSQVEIFSLKLRGTSQTPTECLIPDEEHICPRFVCPAEVRVQLSSISNLIELGQRLIE